MSRTRITDRSRRPETRLAFRMRIVARRLCFCLLLLSPLSEAGEPSALPVAQKEGAERFHQVMRLLLDQHVDGTLTEEQLYQAAIDGMLWKASPELTPSRLKELPRPSNLQLSPSEARRILHLQQGTFTGIGFWIEPRKEEGELVVLRVMPQSPAAAAGLLAGDRIVAVDGKSVADLMKSAQSMFRTDPGESQSVVVLRRSERLEVSLTRAEFPFDALYSEMLPGQIGLLECAFLHSRAAEQARAALLSLKKQQAAGLVLDLRNCLGYSPGALAPVLELLVPAGRALFQIESRNGKRQIVISQRAPVLEVPLVVIIDRLTSGTAEALAVGLAESAGARLVGELSAGRATVEQLIPLDQTASVSLSTQRLFGPGGSSWQGTGVRPHFNARVSDEQRFLSLRAESAQERIRLDEALRTALNLLAR